MWFYIVSGVTHPHIRRREGEHYREELQALAEKLGVSSNLILNNRFVSTERTHRARRRRRYLHHALSPGSPGGFWYAGHRTWSRQGKSFPLRIGHARELLADKRGVIVPFDSPDAIAESVLALLGNESRAPCNAQESVFCIRARNHVAEDREGLHGNLSTGRASSVR